jgi:hypothetical protein
MSGRSANARDYFRISSAPTVPREPAASLESAINDSLGRDFLRAIRHIEPCWFALDSRVLSDKSLEAGRYTPAAPDCMSAFMRRA